MVEGCLKWKTVASLFPNSADFQDSLIQLYVTILGFLMSAKRYYEKSRLGMSLGTQPRSATHTRLMNNAKLAAAAPFRPSHKESQKGRRR